MVQNNPRREQLKKFHHLLNTAEGKEMMEDLKKAWHDGNPYVQGDAYGTHFNIGMSECYKQLEAWQAGEGLHDG